ncbi:hypothetical protein [Mycobacterium camsae]|nr:hypothetical protein [Mycobacterium gordonae]
MLAKLAHRSPYRNSVAVQTVDTTADLIAELKAHRKSQVAERSHARD